MSNVIELSKHCKPLTPLEEMGILKMAALAMADAVRDMEGRGGVTADDVAFVATSLKLLLLATRRLRREILAE